MTSYVSLFSSTKKDKTVSVREVLVMNISDTYMQGFDLRKLTKDERKQLKYQLRGHDVHDRFANSQNAAKHLIPDVDSELMKRCMKKVWKTFFIKEIKPITGSEDLTKTQVVAFLGTKGYGKGNEDNIRRNVNRYLQHPYKHGLYKMYEIKKVQNDSYHLTAKA